jgi:hypothetical protein
MAAITYGSHAPAPTATAEAKSATQSAAQSAPKPGFFTRLWNAMIEARMKQAMIELRQHRHLLPADYEVAGNQVTRKNEDQISFARGR